MRAESKNFSITNFVHILTPPFLISWHPTHLWLFTHLLTETVNVWVATPIWPTPRSWTEESSAIDFWCRIRLWFRLMGVCKQSRWRHSVTEPSEDSGYVLLWQRYDNNKMVGMRYYGHVMISTRWWLCVTTETLWQQRCLNIQMTLALSRMLVAYVRLLMR